MVAEMTWVKEIRRWEDAGQNSWALALSACLPDVPKELWIEQMEISAIVRHFIDDTYPSAHLRGIGLILGAQRMIKSPLEFEVMKEAGEIAGAIMAAAHGSLRVGRMNTKARLL